MESLYINNNLVLSLDELREELRKVKDSRSPEAMKIVNLFKNNDLQKWLEEGGADEIQIAEQLKNVENSNSDYELLSQIISLICEGSFKHTQIHKADYCKFFNFLGVSYSLNENDSFYNIDEKGLEIRDLVKRIHFKAHFKVIEPVNESFEFVVSHSDKPDSYIRLLLRNSLNYKKGDLLDVDWDFNFFDLSIDSPSHALSYLGLSENIQFVLFIEEKEIFSFKMKPITSIILPMNTTEIDNYAFSSHPEITSIQIPSHVELIGDYAFKNCIGLSSITLPRSLKSINVGLFSGCIGLSSVEIPTGVTEIKAEAFSGCKKLKSIWLPYGLISIGFNAFYGCASLSSLIIPESVKFIDSCAFEGCSSLKEIRILNPHIIIYARAFDSGLNFTVPEGSKQYFMSILGRQCTIQEEY